VNICASHTTTGLTPSPFRGGLGRGFFGGERVWKLTGQVQQMYVDGQGYVDVVDLNNKTLYASPYLVYNEQGYSKHYYAGAERVSSRIGGGMQDALDPLSSPLEHLSEQENWEAIANDLLTMLKRGITCTEFDVDRASMESLLFSIGHSATINDPEENWYIYHSDHLGSSSFLTDASGDPTQHLQYMPFGETFIEQHSITSYYTPYTFSAKERDTETGYSYFGARYYDADISVWLSVDPMTDKYPGVSPYNFCLLNPLKYIDPDGNYVDDPPFKSAKELAVQRAYQHLAKKTKYESGKGGEPGTTGDCAGIISDCINYAGWLNHRNNPGMPKPGGGYYSNGVALIVGASVEIGYNLMEPGDVVSFRTGRAKHQGPDGKYDHIGMVVNVNFNDDGTVSNFDFIHITNDGTLLMNWNFSTGKSSWPTNELKLTGAYRWDPGPNILPAFTVHTRQDNSSEFKTIEITTIPANLLEQ
jgi:RHS repeat-associated protein